MCQQQYMVRNFEKFRVFRHLKHHDKLDYFSDPIKFNEFSETAPLIINPVRDV